MQCEFVLIPTVGKVPTPGRGSIGSGRFLEILRLGIRFDWGFDSCSLSALLLHTERRLATLAPLDYSSCALQRDRCVEKLGPLLGRPFPPLGVPSHSVDRRTSTRCSGTKHDWRPRGAPGGQPRAGEAGLDYLTNDRFTGSSERIYEQRLKDLRQAFRSEFQGLKDTSA